MATLVTLGAISLSSSTHLPLIGASILIKPVASAGTGPRRTLHRLDRQHSRRRWGLWKFAVAARRWWGGFAQASSQAVPQRVPLPILVSIFHLPPPNHNPLHHCVPSPLPFSSILLHMS